MGYKKILASCVMGTTMLCAMNTNKVLAADNSIVLENYSIGGSNTITGTYSGTDAVYERVEINGVKQSLVPFSDLSKGKVSYYVGDLNAEDNVELVLYDVNYSEVGRSTVNLVQKEMFDVTLDSYQLGNATSITGTYSGTDAVYERVEINGVKQSLVPFGDLSKGKVSYYVGDLNAEDNVELVLYDVNYSEVGRQSLKITEEQTFTLKGNGSIDAIKLVANDNNVTITGYPEFPEGTRRKVNSGVQENKYFSIKILNPSGQEIFNRSWKGIDYISAKENMGSYQIPDGSTMEVYHSESTNRYTTSNDDTLKKQGTDTFNYRMINGRFVLE